MVTIALILMGLLLTACQAVRDRVPFPGRLADEVEATSLQLWTPIGSEQERILFEGVGAAVLAANPSVSATFVLRDAAATGDALPPVDADVLIFNTDQLISLVEADRLAPFPGDMPSLRTLPANLRAAVTVDGQIYCLPRRVQTLGLFYNRALFDAAEIDYPTATWTWTDLAAAAQAVTALPTVHFTAFGLALPLDVTRWLPFYLQAGGNPDGEQLSTPENRSALATSLLFFTGLLSDTVAVTPSYFAGGWAGEAFANGRVGMVLEGNWLDAYLAAENPDLMYGVTPLPGQNGPGTTVAFLECVGLAAASEQPQLAAVLVETLLSGPVLEAGIPLSPALPADPDSWSRWQAEYPHLAPLLSGVEEAVVWPPSGWTARTIADFARTLDAYFSADPTVADVTIDDIIADLLKSIAPAP